MQASQTLGRAISPAVFLLAQATIADASHSGSAPDREALLVHYYCAEIAAHRMLPAPEAFACAEAYTALKLSLIPGIDREGYDGLTASERAEVNRRAYATFVLWQADHAPLVDFLKANATGLAVSRQAD